MSTTETVGVSMVNLFMILVVAFFAAAMIGAGRSRSGLARIAAAGAIVVLLLLSLGLFTVRMSYQPVGSPMIFDQAYGPQTFVSHSTMSWGVLSIALLIPFAVFLLARLITRVVQGRDAQRTSSPWPWLAAVAACVPIFGGFVWGVRKTTVSIPSMPHAEAVIHGDAIEYVIEPPPAVGTEQPPLDELWDRLTAARIPVGTSETSADGAQSTQASRDSSATENEARAKAPAATHDSFALAPDSGGGDAARDGEPLSKSAKLEKLYQESIDDVDVVTADLPAPRPAWVDQRNNLVVNGVRRVVLEAGPYTQLEECHAELRRKMVEAVQSHLNALVREKTADPSSNVPTLAYLGIGETFISRELLKPDVYVEEGEASFGLTKTAFAMLEFDANDDINLFNAWRTYARRSRIYTTTLVAASCVALLGGIFALLKIDTWTRGYYTKRLFLGVPAAIIGLLTIIAATIG